MHDIRLIRDNPGAFDAAMARRGLTPQAERLIDLDARRREATTRLQELETRRNAASKEIGIAKGRGENDRFEALRAEVEAEARQAAADNGLRLSVEPWHLAPAVAMAWQLRAACEAALSDAGLPALTLPSWAGHDAKVMARHVPAGMLFVPSVGGLSHTPDELSASSDCAAGAQVLLHTALRVAEGA
jgi:hypothetical protein